MTPNRRPLVIVAGQTGQHARVVFEAAILAGWTIAGIVSLGANGPPNVFGAKVLGGEDALSQAELVSRFAIVPGLGDNAARARIAAQVLAAEGVLATIEHPASIISTSAVLGAGSVVLAGGIVSAVARLGLVCIVNHAASVGHDCTLGVGVNLCSGARLGGSVSVGDEVFIGLNAAVLQGRTIGHRATVAAGAVVTRDVPPSLTVAGVPARPLIDLDRATPTEASFLTRPSSKPLPGG